MTIQPGNTSRLNVVKGCSQLLEVDSSDTSLLDKVLPANILLKDSTTGKLYLTDGLHDLSYVFANNAAVPTVNDGTLTVTQGGSTLGTFTANQASNSIIDIPVPSVTAFATNAEIDALTTEWHV